MKPTWSLRKAARLALAELVNDGWPDRDVARAGPIKASPALQQGRLAST